MSRFPAGRQHLLRQRLSAGTTPGKDLTFGRTHPQPFTFGLDEGQLLRQVIGEAVDGDHHRHAVLPQVFQMGRQVAQAGRHRLRVRLPAGIFIAAAVISQRPHRDHQHRRRRFQPGRGALDIKEFFGAEVAAEARLGHGIVGKGECQPGGPHRIAAVGDIGKGAAVHQAGGVLQRLHQVRPQGLPQKGGHGALRLQVTGKKRLPRSIIADEDAPQPFPQVP